ncbi:TnsD family Tn7-like transposition protein [Paraburkholderia phenoliruptrix]|uniref:TnsD family Tn7-like transposition protein n=1 Tax=Paraburkholderia phenoliruptrix TaxID=252970 RepID=UPI0034CF41DA
MAIALFPLGEGETIGSNIGRYAEYLGLESTVTLRRRLFGYTCTPATRLPRSVAHLAEQTRDYWSLAAETIVKQHTEYGYLTMMALRPMRERILKDMLNPPVGNASSVVMCRLTGQRVVKLRYCEECLVAWRDNKIEPYWRIDHQLPGAYVCFLHSSVLKVVKRTVAARDLDSTVVRLRGRCDEIVLQRSSSLEKSVVEDVAKRSARQRVSSNDVTVVQKFRDLLRNAGFIHPDATVKRDVLIAEWLAYFGREYCHLTSMTAPRISRWLGNISERRQAGDCPHPFMFIAAESFLEHHRALPGSFVPALRNREKTWETASSSEWDMVPPNFGSLACTGVLHRKSDSLEFAGRLTGSGGWKLVCSCGISYRMLDGAQCDSIRMAAFAYGARYRKRFRALMEKGYKAQRAGRELHISEATAGQWARAEGYTNVKTPSPVEIRKLRSKWRRLVESAPPERRLTAARRADSGLYRALHFCDKAWLLNYNREHQSLCDVAELRCSQIRQAWLAVMQTEPPVRATQAAILEAAGLVTRSIVRNTSCSLLFTELVETRQAYHERVISWLAAEATRQRLRTYGEVVRLVRLVGLRPARFTREQRVRIRNFLFER